MIFKPHSEWKDRHATLSASKSAWLNYDDEKIFEFVDNLDAARIGTKKHLAAKLLIELGQKLEDTHQTFNMYVNDCIGFRMKPEQVLFYSPFAFGTADAIAFRDNTLYLFDLKNGKNKVSARQLLVYAAFFCLEYKKNPNKIEFDLRIYQNDEIFPIDVDPVEILYIMERAKEVTAMLAERFEEEV